VLQLMNYKFRFNHHRRAPVKTLTWSLRTVYQRQGRQHS